jgi:hypothetical protein
MTSLFKVPDREPGSWEPVKVMSEGASEHKGIQEVGYVPIRVEPRVNPVPVRLRAFFILKLEVG